MTNLVVRRAVESDYVFIMDSWMRSYRKSPDSNLPDSFFFAAYRAIAGLLLKTSTVEVMVTPDNNDAILGYVVYDPGVVHWVYVKRDYRESGLAHILIKRAGAELVFTMTTPLGRKRLRYPVKGKLLRAKMNKELNA